MWKPEFNRPSSALFKDSKGVSVDRDGNRPENQIIANFERRMPGRGLICISAGKYREIGTKPVAKPLEDNAYHAVIYDDDGNVTIKGSKPKKLSNAATVIKAPLSFL
jgi:hypothetical protein